MDSLTNLFLNAHTQNKFQNYIKSYAQIDGVSYKWQDMVEFLEPRCKEKSIVSIVRSLTFVGMIYNQQQKGNKRLFGKGERTREQLGKQILEVVPLKLTCFKFMPTVPEFRVSGVLFWCLNQWSVLLGGYVYGIPTIIQVFLDRSFFYFAILPGYSPFTVLPKYKC